MKPFVEVQSALWQKIFASVVALPFIGLGLACWVSPFVPIFSGPAPHPALAFALGLLLGGFFFCFCWWPVMRYSIRADREGITQFNGFLRQSVRWSQVESYYLKHNPRFHAERRYHIEPFLLNERGEIVFQGFAHILKSTKKIIEQRRALWRFVEEQLEGKRIETPVKFDARMMAIRSFNIDWSKKSWLWKVARISALVCYALIGIVVALFPLYYLISNNISFGGWEVLLVMLVFFVPLIPHLIWIEVRKRRIARELAERAVPK